MASKSSVLVLGATGGIGGEVARQLRDAGWDVRAMQRRASQSRRATRRDNVDSGRRPKRRGCTGGRERLLGYRACGQSPGISTVVGTRAADAGQHDRGRIALWAPRLCCPGRSTISVPTPFRCLTEESPQHPVTRKGAIRVEMERRLLAASKNGARVLDRTGRRFLRTKGGEQLVLTGTGEAGQTGHGSRKSRPPRGRAPVVLPSRCGTHDDRAARAS